MSVESLAVNRRAVFDDSLGMRYGTAAVFKSVANAPVAGCVDAVELLMSSGRKECLPH